MVVLFYFVKIVVLSLLFFFSVTQSLLVLFLNFVVTFECMILSYSMEIGEIEGMDGDDWLA